MASQPYAVVSSGNVTNIVQWDGVTPYSAGTGNTLVSAVGQPNAQIGGTYSGGVFTAPAAPPAALGVIFTNSPTNGSTINLPAMAPQPGPQTLYVILQPASALASLTLNLPPAPNDGSELIIFCTKAVTSLTLTGGTVNNAPTSLPALTQVSIIWSAQFSVWFQL
jgi:hypothetical protein